jgi:Flp pilus assembly protein TadB
MNMNITSTKFLAVTFAFIVYATLLLLIMSALPLHAQTNTSAENGTNSSVAVTASASASNAVAVTGTKVQNRPSEPFPDNTGTHVGSQNPSDNNKTEPGVFALGVMGLLVPLAPFITFIVFSALVFYFRYRRNKMMHETMLAMIEKGVPITPEMLAQLQSRPSRFSNQPGQSRNRRLLPGLILTGVGIALLITNLGGNLGASKAGWIVLSVGVAFLIVWFVERKDKNNDQPPKP